MSSVYVRQQVKQFLDDNSDEDVIDLTAQYADLKELVSEAGLQPDAPWLGLTFVGGQIIPVGLAATNTQGSFRESGAVQLHVVAEARIGVGDSLLARGETLLNLFNNARMGNVVIDDMLAMNTEGGATLEFEDGYMSGTIQLNYHRDFSL